MDLLSLPVEVLFLIIENLSTTDLWSLYNVCHTTRAYSAPRLFRSVKIRFSGAIAVLLNSRRFPYPRNHLLPILAKWALHVREMDLWGDEESIQPEFLTLLPCFGKLTTFSVSYPPEATAFQSLLAQLATMPSLQTMSVDFMSARTWMAPMSFWSLRSLYLCCVDHEPGISVLPALPALEVLSLNFCCYCVYCPRDMEQPCITLNLDHLPRLRALSISGAQEGNIICGGISPHLCELDISFSSGMSLTRILASLGSNLEEVHICDSEFPPEKLLSGQSYPFMRRLSILDSVSALTVFAFSEPPSALRPLVRLNAADLENLCAWPQVIEFFQNHAVDLSLSGPVDAQCLLNQTCRLSEVVSLPGVQRIGPHWPRASSLETEH